MRQTKFMVFPRVRLGRSYHSSVNQCVFTVVRAWCQRGKTQWQLRSQALSPLLPFGAGEILSPSDKGKERTWEWRCSEQSNLVSKELSLHSRGRERTLGTQQQATEIRVVGKTLFQLLCGLHTKIQARASPSSSTMVKKWIKGESF